ncbi:surface antigen-like protein [Leishmania tarentolae]|uniref:Surface antigen-like protein n=1 Tax=Leishmania tarentolae TaxID=5689 RepID=A0A640K9G3_LEITA|nr:surface antigen-like protein [Leishmania tarentolae]
MAVIAFRRSIHKSGTAAVVMLLAIAVAATWTVSAQTIDDLPVVACDSTVPNCLECRQMQLFSLCSKCEDGYSTSVAALTPTKFGKCQPYDPSTCGLSHCLRCAADDNTKCVECAAGYPSITTFQCEETPVPSTPEESKPAPSTPEESKPAPSTPEESKPAPSAPEGVGSSATTDDCQAASCAICVPGNKYNCAVCQPGMVLMASSQCMPVGSCSVANCMQCLSNDDNRCSSCELGHTLTSARSCIPRKSPSAAAAAPTPLMMALAMVALAATVIYVV